MPPISPLASPPAAFPIDACPSEDPPGSEIPLPVGDGSIGRVEVRLDPCSGGRPLERSLATRLAEDCRSATLYSATAPRSETVGLVTFDLNQETQRCVATQLQQFLNDIGFDEMNTLFHGDDYGINTVYDNSVNLAELTTRLRESGLPPVERNAIAFLMYGRSLSEAELATLFRGREDLRDHLLSFGIITRQADGRLRLNNLSLESHLLPNGETMYLLIDLPAKYRAAGSAEPTAQLSSTSHILLHRLERDYNNGVDYTGVAADMGSGTGVQAIALLRMHPGLHEVISLEIDAHAMNLHRFNAMLNGVAEATTIIDNSDALPTGCGIPTHFESALGDRLLSLVVSNPPFNIVPRSLADQFTNFGDGGEHGLDITSLFLRQALPYLEPQGEFVFYSQLAEDEHGQYFLSSLLEGMGEALDVSVEVPHFEDLDYDREVYARVLHHYLSTHGPDPSHTPSQADIAAALASSGVAALHPRFVRIHRRAGSEEGVVLSEREMIFPDLERHFLLPLLPLDPFRGSTGGVFETLETLRLPHSRPGGVFLEIHEVPPNPEALRRAPEAIPHR